MTALIFAIAVQQQTVTFEHPCAHSSVVLKALGEKLGVTMQPGGSVMKDYIVVRFDQVPVEEAMKRLADSLNATWMRQGETNVLTRTPAQESQELQDAHAASVKMVQEWLDKRKVEGQVTLESSRAVIEEILPLLKTTSGQNFNEQMYAKQRSLEAQGPVGRLMTRLLKEIGAEALADIEEGGRAQWVAKPNARQRQLPQGEALRLYTVENEIFKEAVMRSGALDRLSQEGGMYSSLIHPYGPYYRQDGETMLTVTKRRGFYTIRLSVAGAGETYDAIAPSRDTTKGMPKELVEQQGAYVPTDLEVELAKAARVLFDEEGSPATISARAVTALSDPVTYDPLSVFGSKWMLDASKALGRNFIGVVPDEAFLLGMFIVSQGQLGFGQFWQALPGMGSSYKVVLDDRWLTIYPTAPITVRGSRLDREEWKRAIARGAPGRAATLEDYAAYAALSDDENGVMVSTLPAMFMGHGVRMDSLLQTGNLDALRIFGRLTDLQQKAARNGGTEVLISRLPADLSAAVSKLVYQENQRVENKRRVLGWGRPNEYYGGQQEQDPLRVLWRGYPPASVMRVYVLANDVVFQQSAQNVYRGGGATAEQIGQQLAWAEVYPEQYQHLQPMFTVGKAEQLLIEFEFTNTGYLYHRMQVDYLPGDAKYVALKDLPEGVRGEIETSLAKYREQLKNVRRDGGGGG